jgi:hypothetical protein
MKKYLQILVILIIGIFIGIGGTFYWASNFFDSMHKMSAMMKIGEDLEEADYLYKNAKPLIAIYKLQRILSQIEFYEEEGINIYFNEWGVSWDKGLIHGRVGRLNKKIGNSEDASEYLNKSIHYFADAGWILKNEDQMVEAIDMLDTNKISEVIKSIGELKKDN